MLTCNKKYQRTCVLCLYLKNSNAKFYGKCLVLNGKCHGATSYPFPDFHNKNGERNHFLRKEKNVNFSQIYVIIYGMGFLVSMHFINLRQNNQNIIYLECTFYKDSKK